MPISHVFQMRPWRPLAHTARAPADLRNACSKLRTAVRAEGPGSGKGELSPREALLQALVESGLQPDSLKLHGDDDEDEETWDDILDETDDPWMRSPATLEDALEAAVLMNSDIQQTGGPAASERAYEASAAASMTWQQFEAFRAEQQQQGAPGAWVLLDVREAPGRSDGSGQAAPPPGTMQLPLEQLGREAVQALNCEQFAVLGTGDLRAQQAAVRLRNVFGYRNTILVTDWQEWSKGT